jgi:hypothetical protein
VRGIGFFPNDDRVLYTQDRGGNELAHIYVRELVEFLDEYVKNALKLTM